MITATVERMNEATAMAGTVARQEPHLGLMSYRKARRVSRPRARVGQSGRMGRRSLGLCTWRRAIAGRVLTEG
jgi:hypothetical protein